MEAYARFKPFIENVHLKDWEVSSDDKGILCQNGKYIRGGSHGKGLMNQRELLEALEKDGYPNYLAFEYEGILDHEEETRQGFQYLKCL
jgi:sugar phosphate isomerase/epimerase